jgi:hypothetical protein
MHKVPKLEWISILVIWCNLSRWFRWPHWWHVLAGAGTWGMNPSAFGPMSLWKPLAPSACVGSPEKMQVWTRMRMARMDRECMRMLDEAFDEAFEALEVFLRLFAVQRHLVSHLPHPLYFRGWCQGARPDGSRLTCNRGEETVVPSNH